MNEFSQQIKISAIATFILAIILCVIYPFIVWGFGQILFPFQANGSLITNSQGQVIGSRLIGQSFTGPQYFEPRPSYAGNGYDPLASGGSNLGPTSQKLVTNITQAIATYRTENNLSATASVPADAVTGSASGLDPDISITNAGIQASRVVKSRNTSLADIQALINQNIDGRSLGIFGESGVNVLMLNIALDQKYPMHK